MFRISSLILLLGLSSSLLAADDRHLPGRILVSHQEVQSSWVPYARAEFGVADLRPEISTDAGLRRADQSFDRTSFNIGAAYKDTHHFEIGFTKYGILKIDPEGFLEYQTIDLNYRFKNDLPFEDYFYYLSAGASHVDIDLSPDILLDTNTFSLNYGFGAGIQITNNLSAEAGYHALPSDIQSINIQATYAFH